MRRSLRHLVNALAELEALGVAFISLRDNLDLSTPSGRLMFQIIGAMAEFANFPAPRFVPGFLF
jgi:DNA invertase Pin-like site-specific DNA recombinase